MKRIKYIYLLSAPHSGSTLFACILGCHDKIATVGEFGTNFPSTGLCSCGEQYKDCHFWNQLLSEYHQKHGEKLTVGNLGINLGLSSSSFFYELYHHLFPYYLVDKIRDVIYYFSLYRKAAILSLEKSIKLIDILLKMTKKEIFFDSTKNPLQIRFLSAHPLVDLKVIYLVRDGRAVTWSLISKENWTLDQSVKSWLWANRNIERVNKNYVPSNGILNIKFEEFCHEPEKNISKILNFIGTDPHLEIKSIRESGLHIIGNRMRHTFDGTIRKPDESWRKNLSKKQLDYFEKKAGWLNRKFGYS